MERLIYVTVDGTKETDYNKVKGTEYKTELEPVVDVETPEMKQARLERIAKAQAGVVKAYNELKATEQALTERVIKVDLETPPTEDRVIKVTLEQ